MGESRERNGFFGKYTEHFDDDGNKIGESRERDGIFGKYTEHTDSDGNKIGESRDRQGFFSTYTEHTDADRRKTGESTERDGLFGRYTEHSDVEGHKIGESWERDGLFGPYTEHTGSGWFAGSSESKSQPANGSQNSGGGGGRSSGGLLGLFMLIAIAFGALVDVLGNKTALIPAPGFTHTPVAQQNARSEFEKRTAAALEREKNVDSGLVDQVAMANTLALSGDVIAVTEPEGTGMYWTFDLKADDGAVYPFVCGSLSPLYYKVNGRDVIEADGYQQFHSLRGRVTLFIPTSAREYMQRCKNRGCDGLCPSVIAMRR